MAHTDPQQAGDAARARCLYCGANNPPQSTTCWQCNRPLQAIRNRAATGDAEAVARALGAPRQGPSPHVAMQQGESDLASKAAAALGLMFPIFGLPVGIVFLMLDDPRKTKLGWQTIIWSAIGMVLNIGFTILMTLPFLPVLKNLPKMAPSMGGDNLNLISFVLAVCLAH